VGHEGHHEGEENARATRRSSTFSYSRPDGTLGTDANAASDPAMSGNLRDLREESDLDQTLQNLLRALTLNLELRSRYRVFEYEASQDGHPEIARLFRDLRLAESGQIASLMAGLQDRMGAVDLAALGARVG
jgi:hypothetical protein